MLATSTLCTTGIAGAANATPRERSREPFGGRASAASCGTARDTGSITPRLRAPRLGERRSRARPLPRGRRSRAGPGALKLTGSTTSPCAASRQAVARPRRRRRPGSRPSRRRPAGTASCIACARKRTSGTRVGEARARRRRPAPCIRRGCGRRRRPAARRPPRATRATRATPAVSITGCVLTRQVERLRRALLDQRPQVVAQRVATLRRRSRARPGCVGEALHHADRLRALAGKHECELHRQRSQIQRRSTEPHVNPPPTPSSITCWPRSNAPVAHRDVERQRNRRRRRVARAGRR